VAKTPKEELVLAEMIAAAKAAGMKPCKGTFYATAKGGNCESKDAKRCCALGAYFLAHSLPPSKWGRGNHPYPYIGTGNDNPDTEISNATKDALIGFTIGAAFQEAMTR
jgi:hypothetical protein